VERPSVDVRRLGFEPSDRGLGFVFVLGPGNEVRRKRQRERTRSDRALPDEVPGCRILDAPHLGVGTCRGGEQKIGPIVKESRNQGKGIIVYHLELAVQSVEVREGERHSQKWGGEPGGLIHGKWRR